MYDHVFPDPFDGEMFLFSERMGDVQKLMGFQSNSLEEMSQFFGTSPQTQDREKRKHSERGDVKITWTRKHMWEMSSHLADTALQFQFEHREPRHPNAKPTRSKLRVRELVQPSQSNDRERLQILTKNHRDGVELSRFDVYIDHPDRESFTKNWTQEKSASLDPIENTGLLLDPKMFDFSDDQKRALLRKF